MAGSFSNNMNSFIEGLYQQKAREEQEKKAANLEAKKAQLTPEQYNQQKAELESKGHARAMGYKPQQTKDTAIKPVTAAEENISNIQGNVKKTGGNDTQQSSAQPAEKKDNKFVSAAKDIAKDAMHNDVVSNTLSVGQAAVNQLTGGGDDPAGYADAMRNRSKVEARNVAPTMQKAAQKQAAIASRDPREEANKNAAAKAAEQSREVQQQTGASAGTFTEAKIANPLETEQQEKARQDAALKQEQEYRLAETDAQKAAIDSAQHAKEAQYLNNINRAQTNIIRGLTSGQGAKIENDAGTTATTLVNTTPSYPSGTPPTGQLSQEQIDGAGMWNALNIIVNPGEPVLRNENGDVFRDMQQWQASTNKALVDSTNKVLDMYNNGSITKEDLEQKVSEARKNLPGFDANGNSTTGDAQSVDSDTMRNITAGLTGGLNG